jgi:serine/threonine protein kinase
VLSLNPRLYQPPDPTCSPEEARAHIESMDSALDLLKKLLACDATKRLTAHQALMHPFLNDDVPDDEKEKEEKIHPPGKGVCGHFHLVDVDGRRE